MGNEIKIGKLPGMDGWRWASGGNHQERLQARYLGPVGSQEMRSSPTARSAPWLHLWRQRARLSPARGISGATHGARSRRRHPQRGEGRPVARQQGHARHPAGIGVGHVFALGRVFEARCSLSTPVNESAGNGLLRDGCTRVLAAATNRTTTTAGSLAASARTVYRGNRAHRLRPRRSGESARGQTARRTGCGGVECT